MNNLMENEATKPERIKKTFAFMPEVIGLIESHKHATRGKEIDFVSQAVRHYCAALDGEKDVDILCRHIDKALDERFNSQSSRWSHVLFKIAVELSILDHMLAAGFVELTAEEMCYIRNQCTNKIRKTKGLYRFEDALESEKNAHYWD